MSVAFIVVHALICAHLIAILAISTSPIAKLILRVTIGSMAFNFFLAVSGLKRGLLLLGWISILFVIDHPEAFIIFTSLLLRWLAKATTLLFVDERGGWVNNGIGSVS